MTSHSSATALDETPHVTETTKTTIIGDALKRRAQSVIKDTSIDAQSRAVVLYALEINDPWLAELVRRADAGETLCDALQRSEISETIDVDLSEEKLEALTNIICRKGDEPETKSAALFVLMGMLENSRHPQLVANSAKHFAFNRCGELNLYGMVDAQLAVVEGKVLAEQ